jgi:hypothetical protein
MDKMISITLTEYNRLVSDSDFLGALIAAGVDNWNGYDDALDILKTKETD